MKNLNTTVVNTWCPGCGNFAILNAMKTVLGSLGEVDSQAQIDFFAAYATAPGADPAIVANIRDTARSMTSSFSEAALDSNSPGHRTFAVPAPWGNSSVPAQINSVTMAQCSNSRIPPAQFRPSAQCQLKS